MHDVGENCDTSCACNKDTQKKAQMPLVQPYNSLFSFSTELYSYTEESEFKFNREAFEITTYSQGSNVKMIINIIDMSV